MKDAIILGLGTVLCLVIVMLAGLRFWLTSLRQRYGRVDPARAVYLKTNLVASGALAGPATFQFPEAFYSHKLFLVGEIHGYGAMAEIDYNLLVHLNQRAGLVDYVAELSPVETALFNAYLDSGDESITAPVFDSYKAGSRWANADFPEKLRKIKSYNDSLPEGRRIRFTGLDVVQNFDLLHGWLGVQLPRLQAPDAQGLAAAYLPLVESADPKSLVGGQTAQTEVILTLQSMASGLEREATVFDTYAWQVTKGRLGDRPAYGLWGSIHVLRTAINGGFLPFAARVAASGLPAATAMACIPAWSDAGALMMANSEYKRLFRSKTHTGISTRFFENDGPIFFLEGLGDLRTAYLGSGLPRKGFGVFAMGGAGTPFSAPSGFGQLHALRRNLGITFDAPLKPVTSVYDYILLTRGSPAARPVKL